MKKMIFISVGIMLALASCAEPVARPTEEAGDRPSPPPTRVFNTPTSPSSSIPAPSPTSANITREEAIEIASRGLRPAIVQRADITAQVHGWYWEVVFDKLNAKAEELMPFPLKGPPPPSGGFSCGGPREPYPGIWQSVVITIGVDGSGTRSAGARRAPKPGPYVSEADAIESARQAVSRLSKEGAPGIAVEDMSWAGKASIEAYLLGDMWTVLFWEEDDPEHRWSVWVDAVTGKATGASRG